MSFSIFLDDIKQLKIQGANAVAIASLDAVEELVKESKTTDADVLREAISQAADILALSRPTEPCMRNSLNFVKTAKGANIDSFRHSTLENITIARDSIRKSNSIIAEIGARKIKDGMAVYTHCHSSTVVAILKLAWEQGRRFVVYNTETRPLYQGRKTATELSAIGIPVVHHVDSAIKVALRSAEIVLIGCDAITTEGNVINKIGSGLIAEIAYKYDIPLYSCTHSWKFDPKTVMGFCEEIEIRSDSEIWSDKPKGVTIKNYAFEEINASIVTGLITEIGVFRPERLIEEMERRNKWMFMP